MTAARVETTPKELRELEKYIERLARAYLAKWQFQRLEPGSPADTWVTDDGMISKSPYVLSRTHFAFDPEIKDLPQQPSPGSFRGLVMDALAGNIQTIRFNGHLVRVTPKMRLTQTAAQHNNTAALRARSRTLVG